MKTRKRHFIFPLAVAAIAAIIISACSKEEEDIIYDSDGNKYSVVHIGDHYWMKENLSTLSYSDGTGILILQHIDYEWASAGAACCIYEGDDIEGLETEGEMRHHYGVLYNWYAVTSNNNLCPDGWRIPTNEDWEELIAELGGADVAGGKLKSTRTEPDDHPRWNSPNTGATNEYDFFAYPSGCRTSLGDYFDLGDYAYWWTATEYDDDFAVSYYIPYDDEYIDYNYRKKRTGYSVRCVRD